MTNKNEQIARKWAEDFHALNERGVDLSPNTEAAMEYILATTEPSKPPSMADVQWDDDEHFLAEAEGKSGVKIAMIGIEGGCLHGVVTVLAKSVYDQKGAYITDFLPDCFTPTGRKYKLVPDEPEPLPEPEDCQPGDHYLVQLTGGDVVAAERRAPGAAYSWGVPDDCCMDEDITLLARLTPDREVE